MCKSEIASENVSRQSCKIFKMVIVAAVVVVAAAAGAETQMEASVAVAVATAAVAAVAAAGGRPGPSPRWSCPVPRASRVTCTGQSPGHSTYRGPARPAPGTGHHMEYNKAYYEIIFVITRIILVTFFC